MADFHFVQNSKNHCYKEHIQEESKANATIVLNLYTDATIEELVLSITSPMTKSTNTNSKVQNFGNFPLSHVTNMKQNEYFVWLSNKLLLFMLLWYKRNSWNRTVLIGYVIPSALVVWVAVWLNFSSIEILVIWIFSIAALYLLVLVLIKVLIRRKFNDFPRSEENHQWLGRLCSSCAVGNQSETKSNPGLPPEKFVQI